MGSTWGPTPSRPGEGLRPTSKGRPHREIVVLHAEERPALLFPDLGPVQVLLRKVTVETSETHFSEAHQARRETGWRADFSKGLPLGTFSPSGSDTQTPSPLPPPCPRLSEAGRTRP